MSNGNYAQNNQKWLMRDNSKSSAETNQTHPINKPSDNSFFES